ncbi:protein-tyrosine-phosphatase [Sphingobacterium suaedae]|uniref:Protein-tyrosine-phosphatase n=1 Tax=Sphingobacterium suaedae TaxID=1686402 RepID=A0ABW5KJB5_9SPHI
MYPKITQTIQALLQEPLNHLVRDEIVQPLIDFVQKKVHAQQPVNLHFICTHNSRRSHLSQAWAQAAAAYFEVPRVYCYSGGTEETALFPLVAETLSDQGFHLSEIGKGVNPLYALKYDENAPPVVGFSKTFDHPFNPVSAFAAVMTCTQADQGCPFIPGAEQRIPIPYEDPKIADGTPGQKQVYAERSLEIAREMMYVFSKIDL